MTNPNRKEIFSINGFITLSPTGRGHEFMAKSEKYLADQLNRLPLEKDVTVTFFEHKAMRSGVQLSYHWVLVSYISTHSGFTKTETHEAIMRIVFGTKLIKLGAHTVQVRESMSDEGRLTKSQVTELIAYDLQLCADLEINVPSPTELGYMTGK